MHRSCYPGLSRSNPEMTLDAVGPAPHVNANTTGITVFFISGILSS